MTASSENSQQPADLEPVVRGIRLEQSNDMPAIRAGHFCDLLWVNFRLFVEVFEHILPNGYTSESLVQLPRIVFAAQGGAFMPWVDGAGQLANALVACHEELRGEQPSPDTIARLSKVISDCRLREVRQRPAETDAAQNREGRQFSLVLGPLDIVLRVLTGVGPAIQLAQFAKLLRIELDVLFFASRPATLSAESWVSLFELHQLAAGHAMRGGGDAAEWLPRCRDLAGALWRFALAWATGGDVDVDDLAEVRRLVQGEEVDASRPATLHDCLSSAPGIVSRFIAGRGYELAINDAGLAETVRRIRELVSGAVGTGESWLEFLALLSKAVGLKGEGPDAGGPGSVIVSGASN